MGREFRVTATQLFNDPGIKEPFLGKTMFNGEAAENRGKSVCRANQICKNEHTTQGICLLILPLEQRAVSQKSDNSTRAGKGVFSLATNS